MTGQSVNFLRMIFILLSLFAISQGRDLSLVIWEKSDDRDGIVTYREKDPKDAIVAVRGQTVIDAPLEIVLSMLVDASYKNQTEWVPNLLEFKTVDGSDIFNRTLYVRIDIPWPLHDRDFLYSAKIRRNSADGSVELQYRSISIPYVTPDHTTRGTMNTLFILTPVDNGRKTAIDLRAAANPNGSLPTWIVNLAQRNYSFTMLKKARERIVRSRDSATILPAFEDIGSFPVN